MSCIVENFLKKEELDFPGIYKMFDQNKTVIYVGKAKNLKNRLSSYKKPKEYKVKEMIKNVFYIETQKTKDEFDAIVLESKVIKLYQPRYNIILKDNKSNMFIIINKNEEFPSIKLIRERNIEILNKNYVSVGPFLNRGKMLEFVKFIQKNFQIRNCSDNFFKSRVRACLEYQIKRCTAPCVSLTSKENYFEQIMLFENFIKKDKKIFIKEQKLEIKKAIEEMNFELAKSIQSSINLIESISFSKLNKNKNIDIVIFKRKESTLFCSITIIRSFLKLETIKIKKEINNKTTKELIFEILSDLYNKINNPDVVFIEEF